MTSVNFMREIWLYALDKNSQQGYGSPTDFNNCINIAQKSYAAYLLGGFQTYTPGRPVSKVELGQNSVVRTRLTPIIYGYNLNIDSTGFAPYPNDYLQTDAMWSLYGLQRVRWVPQERLWSYYKSTIDPIANNPIYLLEDLGNRFYPASLGGAKLSYVRNPPDIVWGYVDDANGMPVYSEIHSTQPVWDDASCLEIIVRALRLASVNLQMNVVAQYANEVKQLGP